MTENTINKISDAEMALNTIHHTEMKNTQLARPSWPLTMCASLCLGVQTLASGLVVKESYWVFLALGALLGLILCVVSWFRRLAAEGIKASLYPKTSVGKIVSVISGLVVAACIFGSMMSSSVGIMWPIPVLAILNALIFALLWRKFPVLR